MRLIAEIFHPAKPKETPMLAGYKTYILALVAVITAIANYAVGDATLGETIQLLVTGGGLATLRNAIGTRF